MKKILSCFLCVILVLCLAACGAKPAGTAEPSAPAAVTIDGVDYSAADVDYFYHSVFNNLLSNPYAVYIGISSDMDLHDTMNETARYALGVEDENITWDAYLKGEAINNLKYVTALNKAAKADGFTFTAEMQRDLDDQMDQLRTAAGNAGMTEAAYLKALYGDNVTVESFTAMWEQVAVASAYRAEHQNNLTFSDSELEAYYTEHKDDLDTVSFEVIFFDGTPATRVDSDGHAIAVTDEEKAAAKEAAHTAANEAMERFNAGEPLEVIARDYENASYNKEEAGTNSSSDVMKWLFDAARRDGDATLLETDLNYYLLVFHGRARVTGYTVNVRHILFLTDTASLDKNSQTYEADVQAVRDAARKKAEDTLAQWKAGEATEDSFAAMANELSEDPGSNTRGGLYEKVYPGQMVQPFNDWCFDESRKAGDTGVVETSYGYHVMYFSGNDVPYWQMVAENDLRSRAQQEWLQGLVENLTVTEGPAMQDVG